MQSGFLRIVEGLSAPVTGLLGSYIKLMPRSISLTTGCRPCLIWHNPTAHLSRYDSAATALSVDAPLAQAGVECTRAHRKGRVLHKHEVLALDVAVDDAVLVHESQPLRHLQTATSQQSDSSLSMNLSSAL